MSNVTICWLEVSANNHKFRVKHNIEYIHPTSDLTMNFWRNANEKTHPYYPVPSPCMGRARTRDALPDE